MTDDIVAELDHWIRGAVQSNPHLILQRARDEIVALRGYREGCERQFQEQVRKVGELQDEIVALREALAEAREEHQAAIKAWVSRRC